MELKCQFNWVRRIENLSIFGSLILYYCHVENQPLKKEFKKLNIFLLEVLNFIFDSVKFSKTILKYKFSVVRLHIFKNDRSYLKPFLTSISNYRINYKYNGKPGADYV